MLLLWRSLHSTAGVTVAAHNRRRSCLKGLRPACCGGRAHKMQLLTQKMQLLTQTEREGEKRDPGRRQVQQGTATPPCLRLGRRQRARLLPVPALVGIRAGGRIEKHWICGQLCGAGRRGESAAR